jgi:hypothetical protein
MSVLLPRLPKKPLKPYIQPVRRSPTKEAKRMTIGIGMYTLEGVVLGADRQMTRTGLNKFFETKLFHHLTNECILAMVVSNDLSLGKEVWDKLLKFPIDSSDFLREAVEAILNEMGRFYAELPLQFFIGIATKEDTELLSFAGTGIHTVRDFGVIGIGDASLVRFLSDQLHGLFNTLKETLLAAIYTLSRAEDYVDGCDGPIDLIALKPGPSIQIIRPDLVKKIDESMQKNQRKVFSDLLSISSPFPT